MDNRGLAHMTAESTGSVEQSVADFRIPALFNCSGPEARRGRITFAPSISGQADLRNHP